MKCYARICKNTRHTNLYTLQPQNSLIKSLILLPHDAIQGKMPHLLIQILYNHPTHNKRKPHKNAIPS